MSQQNAQALKTNMFSIFLPTFLAIMFAVPMAAVLSFIVLRTDRSSAEAVQTANTGVQYACIAPATTSVVVPTGSAAPESVGTPMYYGGAITLPMSTGAITQNSTTITTTSYDYSVTGSYNNTQSWTSTDSHENTQSWTNTDSFNSNNNNQNAPNTSTTSTTNTTTNTVYDNSATDSNNSNNNNQNAPNTSTTSTTNTVNDNSNTGNNSSTNTTVDDNSNTQSIGDIVVLLPLI